jgi:hypothetical protein
MGDELPQEVGVAVLPFDQIAKPKIQHVLPVRTKDVQNFKRRLHQIQADFVLKFRRPRCQQLGKRLSLPAWTFH